MPVLENLKRAWNAFRSVPEEMFTGFTYTTGSLGSTYQTPRRRNFGNDRSIATSVYNRIAMDVAAIEFKHVKLDELGRYAGEVESDLNWCLKLEPNLDQGPRHFRQDAPQTMFDHGVIAIVPVDTDVDPAVNERFDVRSLRVGTIVEWKPRHVRVSIWNEETGRHQEVLLDKRFVAIVENPLYAIMNEPNGTMQRLIRKLRLLDNIDETSAGRLDMIIQLPYVVKNEARKAQAEARRSEIEWQLKSSQYGIAYTDGTEKVVQLNRPVDNGLLKQVEYLTNQLYDELGITAAVMNGTADESAMINYQTRTVEPIAQAIKEAMERAFLGKKRVQAGEAIRFFKDPFRLVPISSLAEVADIFSRNEILTPNEIRGFMGITPSTDKKADELNNSNMPPKPEPPTDQQQPPTG